MPISLDTITFNPATTSVEEKLEEVGGRDVRVITLRGLLGNSESLEALEERLDTMLSAASRSDYSSSLSLRAGRRYWVRRARFRRDVSRHSRAGAFELVLEARDPFEEATVETVVSWSVEESGTSLALNTVGNADTLLDIAMVAVGNVIRPAFDDGTYRLTYTGTVEDGQTLHIDGPARRVYLDGHDVTPYTLGAFPGVSPDGTTLAFDDDAASSHTAGVTLRYRDRWW